jgi:CRP/FNR family transcriptional regulator, cyclic AMP receptor protein
MISPEQLRRYPFFGGLLAEELASIAMIAEEVSFPDGAIIFRDGDLATKLYVLASGAVDLVYHIERTGGIETSFVGSIAAGEPFAISAVVEPYRLTATGVAHGPIQVIAIDAAGLRALCELSCHMGYAVMRQIARALAERLSFAFIELAACK